MKRKTLVAIAVFVFFNAGFLTEFAQAEDNLCYQTGFERPDFLPGQLNGQQQWLNPTKTALISDYAPYDGFQSIRAFGNKLNPISPELVGTAFGRLTVFDASGKTVDVSVDAFLDGPSTATSMSPNPNDDLISANLHLILADALINDVDIGWLLLSSSGHVWILDHAGSYRAVAPIDLNAYHRLAARINFEMKEVEFYVDDSFVTTLPIPDSVNTNIFAIGALELIAVNDKKVLNRNLYKAYFDNYCGSTASCPFQCIQ